MNKKTLYTLATLLLLCSCPCLAQQVGKQDVPLSNTIHITAVAIPGGKPENLQSDTESNHQAVQTTVASQIQDQLPAVVEITVAALKPDADSLRSVRKEIVTTVPQNRVAPGNAMPVIIEIQAPAIKL